MSDIELGGTSSSKRKDDDHDDDDEEGDIGLPSPLVGKNKVQNAGGWKSAVAKQMSIELAIFKSNDMWPWILMGVLNQYVHSVWTNLVFYFYEVRPKLKDLGFDMTPKLGEDYFWVSEAVFYPLFLVGMASTFWPILLCCECGLCLPSYLKPHNLVTLFRRVMIHLTICQTLRAASFMFTILPGPADHCQDANNKNFNQPDSAVDVLFKMDASYGCGDLVFSSHTIFTLTVCLLITYYLPVKPLVFGAWFIQAVLVFLILCSRKHYTVDIVVALYTVPMVWALLQWKLKDPKVVMYYDK